MGETPLHLPESYKLPVSLDLYKQYTDGSHSVEMDWQTEWRVDRARPDTIVLRFIADKPTAWEFLRDTVDTAICAVDHTTYALPEATIQKQGTNQTNEYLLFTLDGIEPETKRSVVTRFSLDATDAQTLVDVGRLFEPSWKSRDYFNERIDEFKTVILDDSNNVPPSS